MNESLLISQVEPLRGKAKPGEAIGVLSNTRWHGRDTITVGQETWQVAQCDSVLELRERLAEEREMPLVIVTPLSTPQVGDDVRARLYKQRVLTVDPWALLAARFKARQVDPMLRQQPELADAALEAMGEKEPLPAASGILTAEAVWQVIMAPHLGLETARPDLLTLLEWLASGASEKRWQALEEKLRERLRSWLARNLGELGEVLLRSLESGHGPDALALGLALGALRVEPSDPEARVTLGSAQGRLERFTGNLRLSAALIRQWNEASEQWAALLSSANRANEVRQQLARADQILDMIGATDFAVTSRWSPLGYQQRLTDFAEALNGSNTERLKQTIVAVTSHEAAARLEELRGRRERAEMAMRLRRWLDLPAAVVESLDASMHQYVVDGSWADWARHQLLSGDEPEAVSRSYRRLFDRVTERREKENRTFAELLVTATRSNEVKAGVLPIEQVLDRLVAPLAHKAAAGVLLVVMDGMSLAVAHELNADLARHGWLEWMPSDGPGYSCALAALPSTTSFSRASLLCGALASGGQNVEKRCFEEHASLRAAGKSSAPPVLFHKDDIGASGADLAESVRLEIRNANRKVVGAVVNVVDDSLDGPEQRAFRWPLDEVPVLRALLSEARDAGRVVILLSDHGHVLDHGSTLARRQDAADRWRPATPDYPPTPQEVLVSGPRVSTEGHQFIAPVTEGMRYTPNRRQGYHGGLTPQECLAPISVVAPSLLEIDGWEPQTMTPPDWWFESAEVAPQPVPIVTGRRGRAAKRPSMPLFEESPQPADWVSALLGSAVFAQQMEVFAGRLRKEQVEQALRVLAERNGVQMKPAFAQQVGLPLVRVDGLLAALQRILNVDGYPVLTVDSSQTIRLNLTLLKEQFAPSEGPQQ